MARAALLPVALLLCLALACRADVAMKTVGVYELKNKKGIRSPTGEPTLMSVIESVIPKVRFPCFKCCILFRDNAVHDAWQALHVSCCVGNLGDVVLGYD
jgi:hypothetical protein